MTTGVNRLMIALAREARGWHQKDLAREIGVSQAKISKYENGFLNVTEDDLLAISKATGMSPEFFYSREKIEGLGSAFLFNRKRRTAPIRIQRQIQAKVNIAKIQIKRLLESSDLESPFKLRGLNFDARSDDPAEAARRVRAALRLPMGPVHNVTQAIESVGGIIAICDYGTDMIDASHLWCDHFPMFFMNKDMPGDRHRWNLAHELGHACLHEYPEGDVEQQADRFAAEFLAPADEIAPELTNLSIRKLAMLKQRWRISMAAILYRAKELQIIGEKKAGSMYAGMNRLGYRKSEPIEIPFEQPSVLPGLVKLHQLELNYSDDDMYRLLMTDNPEFADFGNTIRSRTVRINRPIPIDPFLKKA